MFSSKGNAISKYFTFSKHCIIYRDILMKYASEAFIFSWSIGRVNTKHKNGNA